MKHATVIIGSNFGDEGKGAMTDYAVSRRDGKCLVVRFNGGSQAGHTVVTPDGRRHVFGHVGAGSFAGADTYLSMDFIVNPMTFHREMVQLHEKGCRPTVFVDLAAPVTTHVDTYINQSVEQHRGASRHGSCGLGIFETVRRTEHLPIRFADLKDFDRTWAMLTRVIDEWMPRRMLFHGLPPESVTAGVAWARQHRALWMSQAENMAKTAFEADTSILDHPNVVFEGAQGLLLDQNNTEMFPYLTPSNTGITNVAKLGLQRFDEVEVVYATRSYLTRHGAGPLPHEQAMPNIPPDVTNVDNPWQKHFRYAPLNLNLTAGAINKDFQSVDWDSLTKKVSVRLAMTNLDWTLELPYIGKDGLLRHRARGLVYAELAGMIGAARGYRSYGPTRNDVKEWPE